MARDILVSTPTARFSAPLGSEASVREYWSDPAGRLGLPLIASVYERGFHEGISWSGAELDSVGSELDSLENYWRQQPYGEDLAAQLGERCRNLREALRLAKEWNSALEIA